jgi:hypothetical protein
VKIQNILPVMASIAIIILVAIIEKRSKFVAAITAVMPIAAPLSLWIVYAANDGDRQVMVDFSRGMLIGVLPTLGFLLAVWLGSRAGLKLIPMILMGYSVWGVGVGLTFLVKRALGI